MATAAASRPNRTAVTTARVAHLWHLVRRFAGSLDPSPPSVDDERWAVGHLNDGERVLWSRLSNPDRRHGIAVARAVRAELGERATEPVMAAALLHDSGKVVSGFGTFARVGATLFWAVADRGRAEVWAVEGTGIRRRLGQYRRHPEIGGELLELAGSDPLTSAWAREHHRPAKRWTVDPAIGAVLKSCDDD
ncbi:MAG: hypothetical protein AAGD35_11325 [Actinomycetota bacterium]